MSQQHSPDGAGHSMTVSKVVGSLVAIVLVSLGGFIAKKVFTEKTPPPAAIARLSQDMPATARRIPTEQELLDQALKQLTDPTSDAETLGDALWATQLYALPAEERESISLAIAAHLAHPDDGVRNAAAIALRNHVNPLAIPAILDAIERPSSGETSHCFVMLGKHPTPEVAARVAGQMLDPEKLHFATMSLEAMGPVAEEAALERLSDPDRNVRLSARRILVKVGGPKSLVALQALRESVNKYEREFLEKEIATLEARLGM